MIDTFKAGPYNIVGLSWGGPLSIDIAKHLENMGKKVQLFLIDGVPDTLKALAEQDGENIKEKLLKKILRIANNKEVRIT